MKTTSKRKSTPKVSESKFYVTAFKKDHSNLGMMVDEKDLPEVIEKLKGSIFIGVSKDKELSETMLSILINIHGK